MSKYKQLVGTCPECSETTMFDERSEIICQGCGLVIFRPGISQIAISKNNSEPIICSQDQNNIPINLQNFYKM